MHGRILWIFTLLFISLTLAAMCAADDGNQLLQPEPKILQAKGADRLSVAPPRQSLVGQPRAIILGATSPKDFDGVEKVLANYQSAFEAMSLSRMSEVWPDLDRRRQAAFKGVFEFLRKTSSPPRLDLQCIAPAIAEASVSIECREAVTYSGEDRKLVTAGPVRVSIQLKKQSDNWVIESIKAL